MITHYVTRSLARANESAEVVNSKRFSPLSARIEARPPSMAHPKRGPLYLVIVEKRRGSVA